MNASFQDYDFSNTKSDAFSLVPDFETLTKLVDSQLSATVTNYYEIKRALWAEVDKVIKINECKLYSYRTGYTGDPFGEDGVMWSFTYFFHNKSLKRILFMSCRAFRADPAQNLSAEQIWGDSCKKSSLE
ncbi:unnamed protein product [Gongylonema pulchrum]|nr:unnamed protein product [Gongylonema pulchrum]